ncbi:replication fork protection component Swi3-domain-containing protein [Hygrophoropsis aurantiaca]|uniref:Replication fork protection component Swi3-domain-containing protein n=1 Tax=Hygrophoropsis aurantiaca TaxID=72124 RepID=A0ACB8AMT4_9AGAM|nr:replication fork protection component Swi3-domain-containing protein [Hygrophoropsis aurantiaca]
MSLDEIWDAPISPARSENSPNPVKSSTGTQKRSRPSLFLSDSDDELPVTTKSVPPEVDAMFEDMDNDEDLVFKPLAPALDLEALRRNAEAKHAKRATSQPSLTPHQILPSSSPGRDNHDENEGGWASKDKKSGQSGEGDKKERKKLPKLDEERLLGPNGFPQLIKDTKNFRIKGKGHEASDLGRLLQTYQFWAHKMYPKTQFGDTVERVEKLCHSKRMHVALSVWRDEANGLVNGKKPGYDEDDVIDLTSGPEEGLDAPRSDAEEKNASSGPASLPPSSEAEDDYDDFDIDAVIREEEQRLAVMRAANASEPTPQTTSKGTYRSQPTTDSMDIDEDAMWDDLEAFNKSSPPSAPQIDGTRTSEKSVTHDQDEDMWDVVRELEDNETSSTVSIGDTTRATNDEGWDDMYT